jgi:hypothetical protein
VDKIEVDRKSDKLRRGEGKEKQEERRGEEQERDVEGGGAK